VCNTLFLKELQHIARSPAVFGRLLGCQYDSGLVNRPEVTLRLPFRFLRTLASNQVNRSFPKRVMNSEVISIDEIAIKICGKSIEVRL